jgi:hypothetical protein
MAKTFKYKFTGKEGGSLPEATVKKWIQNFQDHHVVRAHFFGKEFLTKILNQPGCMGIRFHYAIDDKGQKQLVIVGANADGENMWPSSGKKTGKGKLGGGGGGDTGDQAYTCPPYC